MHSTRLVLLGTGGGPRLTWCRSQSAQAIVVDGIPYLVDCGFGVNRQFARAGLPIQKLRGVFVTHHHSDHNGDYGSMLHQAWLSVMCSTLHTAGPPPIVEMTGYFLKMHAYDIALRIADEGRPALRELLQPYAVCAPGVVFDDGHVRVTAALVDHPPIEIALAYRFDTARRSIVICGDTRPSANLIRLASEADVLVHEALYAPGIEGLLRWVPHAPRLAEHLLASHTRLEQSTERRRMAQRSTGEF